MTWWEWNLPLPFVDLQQFVLRAKFAARVIPFEAWIGNVHQVGRFLIPDSLCHASRWGLMFLSLWKFAMKRWRICGTRQPKYRVCCPLFCFFLRFQWQLSFDVYFFSLFAVKQSHSTTFKVSICYCSLVLFLAVYEKVYSQKLSSPETYSLCQTTVLGFVY